MDLVRRRADLEVDLRRSEVIPVADITVSPPFESEVSELLLPKHVREN